MKILNIFSISILRAETITSKNGKHIHNSVLNSFKVVGHEIVKKNLIENKSSNISSIVPNIFPSIAQNKCNICLIKGTTSFDLLGKPKRYRNICAKCGTFCCKQHFETRCKICND